MTRFGSLRRMFLAVPAALLCVAEAPARADYVTPPVGMIEIIAPAPSLRSGDLQSNTAIRTFAENRGLTLANSVQVDNTATGTFTSNASLVGGTIAAGTSVDSYIFHSDTTSGSQVYTGSISFTTAILGVIALTNTLGATDAALGHAGTAYSTSSIRGLELSQDEDFFSISADRRTLTLHFTTHSSVDEIRVVTAASAVPEPASAALLGLGAAILGGVGARRRRARLA